jgi:hypothetical protein
VVQNFSDINSKTFFRSVLAMIGFNFFVYAIDYKK